MGFTSLVEKHRRLLKSHSCAEFQPCRFHLNDPVKCVTTAVFSAFEINDVSLYDSISLPQLLPGDNRKQTRKQNAISFLSQRPWMVQGLPAPVCVPVQLCPLHQRRLSIVRLLSKRDNEATRTETEDRVSTRGCLTLMLEIISCASPGVLF